MKIKNLCILICMLFLLNVSLAYAVDVNPILEFSTSATSVTSTVELQASAVDVMTNAGILWIRFYEDENLLEEKNCGGLTSCVFSRDVTHLNGGVFSYYAATKDKGANYKQSDPITVTFGGDYAPQYSNLSESPASPVVYDPNQTYQFNVTWIDDYNETSTVVIEHNFTGVLTNYSATGNNGSVYYYDYTGIPAGNYVYTWYADDLTGNSNNTGAQSYQVIPANTTLSLTAVPGWVAAAGNQTNVSCSADNNEVTVDLYRDGVLAGSGVGVVSDIQTLGVGNYSYVCNTSNNINYNFAEVSKHLTPKCSAFDLISSD